jgi:hypothetical protein
MPRIELLPAVTELDHRIRGRLIYQALQRIEHEPAGTFVFAGWLITYVCENDTLTIGMQEFYS